MMRKIFRLLAISFLILTSHVLAADIGEHKYFDEVGIKIGYGGDNWSLLPSLDAVRPGYMTGMVAGYVATQFNKTADSVSSYYFEPIYQQSFEGNFETGINFGLQYRRNLTEKLDGFISFEIGPHYASALTKAAVPSNGFTIEVVLGAGGYLYLSETEAITLSANICHNSNGRFFFPNYMNNDLYCTLGYAFFCD